MIMGLYWILLSQLAGVCPLKTVLNITGRACMHKKLEPKLSQSTQNLIIKNITSPGQWGSSTVKGNTSILPAKEREKWTKCNIKRATCRETISDLSCRSRVGVSGNWHHAKIEFCEKGQLGAENSTYAPISNPITDNNWVLMLKSEAISDSSRHPRVGASGNRHHAYKCDREDKMQILNSNVKIRSH